MTANSFIMVPSGLLYDPSFREISVEAKLLYAILADRTKLSEKNGWTDKSGRVYVICTIGEVQELLSIGNRKACRILNELSEGGLIERRYQGLGRPNLIYVNAVAYQNEVPVPSNRHSQECQNEVPVPSNGHSRECQNEVPVPPQECQNEVPVPPNGHSQECQNDTSRDVKTTPQEMSKGHTNHINNNHNNYIYTENNHINSIKEAGYDVSDRKLMREKIKKNLEYGILVYNSPRDMNRFGEILELMVDTVCSTEPFIRVSGENKPTEVVRDVFMSLTGAHILYVLDCMKQNTSEVHNMRRYLITALYNAPQTMENYYENKFNRLLAFE